MPDLPPAARNAQAHAALLRLVAWVQEQGGSSARVYFRVDADGQRELCAAGPLPAGALLLHIPRHLLITLDAARASPIGRAAHHSHSHPSDWGYMALHIAHARRTSGPLAPFVAVLPTAHPGLPTLFSDEALAPLQGFYVLPAILRRRARLDDEYQRIAQHLPPEYPITRDEFLWAWCCMQTRYFDTRFGAEHTHSMIPLADMPNHTPAPNMRWHSEATQGMVMTALRPIAAGEPLTISYSHKSNAELLSDYGFCIAQNPYDRTEIRLPPWPAGHPCQALAAGLGLERPDGRRAFRVRASASHAATRDLWAWLRLGALSSEHTMDHPEAALDAARAGPLDPENERRARATLAQACTERLAEFATSVPEDQQLLQDGTQPWPLRQMVQARLGEKQLLLHYRKQALRAV